MVVGEDPPALRELSVPLMAEEEFSHQTTKRERTRLVERAKKLG